MDNERLIELLTKILLDEANKALNVFELLKKIKKNEEAFFWLEINHINEAVESCPYLERDENVILLHQEDVDVVPVKELRSLFPGEWQFIDDADISAFRDEWLDELFTSFLMSKKKTITQEDKDEGRSVLAAVDELLSVGFNEIKPEQVQEIWNLVDSFNSGPEGEHQRLQKSLIWGEWRLNTERVSDTYDLGTGRCQLIYPKSGTTTIHEYSRKPARLSWPLLKVQQNKVTYYLSTAPIKEVDAVSAVPDLPEQLDCWSTAGRILDRDQGKNEWQRQLNVRRREAIMNFMSNKENIIANAPILYVAGADFVTIENERKLSISMDFLEKETLNRRGEVKTTYRDVCINGSDERPFWLIDGQHRIRGGAGSELGREVNVPLIIFPNEISLADTAKIFAEINTLQEPLDTLHQLFMQHRFHIPSPNSKNDFGLDGDGRFRNKQSRANHFSYEMAAKLCSDNTSPLYKKIQLLKQNADGWFAVDAKQWLDFTRNWMNSIYDEQSGMSFEAILSEVGNYFKALRGLRPTSVNSRPPWPSGGRIRALPQKRSTFIAFLLCYSRVRRKAFSKWFTNDEKTASAGGPIPQLFFSEAMQPWKNIDWQDDNLIKRYNSGGEKARRSLQAWLEYSLEVEDPAPMRSIHNNNNRSVPGMGIFAPPKMNEIVIQGDSWLTAKGQKMTVFSDRPVNALPTSSWQLLDPEGTSIQQKSIIADHNGRAWFKIPWTEDWENKYHLIIRCSWENINGSAEKHLDLMR